MAESKDCEVLSMFVDDFAEEVELNPDSELDFTLTQNLTRSHQRHHLATLAVLDVVFQARLKEEVPAPTQTASRRKLKVKAKCC